MYQILIINDSIFVIRICGHKHLDTKIDKRPFGFPFDREINFKFDNNER